MMWGCGQPHSQGVPQWCPPLGGSIRHQDPTAQNICWWSCQTDVGRKVKADGEHVPRCPAADVCERPVAHCRDCWHSGNAGLLHQCCRSADERIYGVETNHRHGEKVEA